jgi:hypothetical protein
MLAVAGHAQNVVPQGAQKQGATVSVTGGIEGFGDPSGISIAFVDRSFRSSAGTFISNPDYSPSLRVYADFSVHPTGQVLSYYYCDSPEHVCGELLCDVPEHSPEHYKRLRIFGGIKQKGSNQVVFPAGSIWKIGFKTTGVVEREGILKSEVIYNK